METAIGLRRDAANWWVYLLSGLLLIGLGFLAFSHPGRTYLGLSLWFSAVILVNGLAGAFFAFSNRATLRGWGWLLALGLAEALLGLYLLSVPLAAAGTLAFVIGCWLLFRSSITLSNAFALKNLGHRGWGWVLASSLLGGLFAVLVLVNPGLGALGAAV